MKVCLFLVLLFFSSLSFGNLIIYDCKIKELRGNRWICTKYPELCSFVFYIDHKLKKIYRSHEKEMLKVLIDKWNDKKLIAHENFPKIDDRFTEQYFYKINFLNNDFLMANEYITSSGRYLSQDDIDLAFKKNKRSFSYYKPKLFSEKGICELTNN